MKVKKYLMSGVAALAIGLSLAGCSGDDLFTQEDAIRNAKEVLGISIDADRNWNMATQVTANVAVIGDYAVNYEVVIYENNPFVDNKGTVLARKTVYSGDTASFDFTVPKGLRLVYVCLRDAKGYNYVKPVGIVDGKLETSFGGAETASTPSFFATRNGATRGTEADDFVIPEADVPFTAEEINAYMANAKEPNDENIADNHDGSVFVPGSEGHWVIDRPATDATLPGFGWHGNAGNYFLGWNPANVSQEDKDWFDANCRAFAEMTKPDNGTTEEKNAYIDLFWEVYYKLQDTGRGDWMQVWGWPTKGETEVKHWEEATEDHWDYDETYVLDFKITGTWNKLITVLSSEDGMVWDATANANVWKRSHRDVYISGKWTLPSGEQRVGGGATIVVLNGGELNIPADAYMTYVNQARLVVMPGGKITGAGKINITNGTAEDGYGYNGGTISIGTFTNNFGTFFNYGNLMIQNMEGASTYSLYVNHGKTLVQSATKGSNTANMRVYNNCWFESTSGFACRNIVQGENAYFKAANLELSSSEDGTSDPSFIYAKANSLIDIPGAVALNNVNIIGPTGEGDYAYLQFGYVEGEGGAHNLSTATNFTTAWGGNGEYVSVGAIQNNIRLSVDHPEVDSNPSTLTPYEKVLNLLNGEMAAYVAEINPTLDQYNQKKKFPCQGNGNATMVRKGQYNTAAVPASECSPGITPDDPEEIEEENKVWSYAFEDSYHADYDMNDVVIRVQEKEGDASKLIVTLCCTGASYNLTVNLTSAQGVVTNIFNGTEVHAVLGCASGKFVNTGTADNNKFFDAVFQTTEINKPSDFTFGTADFWIQSPEGEMHVSKTGQDPHGIIVPGDWAWPLEFTSIKVAYPQFSQYFIDGGVNEEYEDWYNHPDESKVYRIQE